MRAILVPLLLLFALAACAADPALDCRLDKVAELPVQRMNNVPVLTVEINGKPASLILDTGSDATVLTRVAARRLGVAEGGAVRTIGGAGGKAQVAVARIDTLALGPVLLSGARALLADAPAPPIDGLLGIDVMVDYELELDVPQGRVTLYRARSCITAQPNWTGPIIRLPVQQKAGSGHLFVPVEADGEKLRGMLDSGASRSTLSLQAAEDIKIHRRALAQLPATRSQTVNAGGMVVRTAAIRELRVGPDRLDRPQIAVADLPAFAGDLLIGADYMTTRKMWISFKLGRVFVAP